MVVWLAMHPGASVARVARDHGVNANQVFTWRRQHAPGQLDKHSSRNLKASGQFFNLPNVKFTFSAQNL